MAITLPLLFSTCLKHLKSVAIQKYQGYFQVTKIHFLLRETPFKLDIIKISDFYLEDFTDISSISHSLV